MSLREKFKSVGKNFSNTWGQVSQQSQRLKNLFDGSDRTVDPLFETRREKFMKLYKLSHDIHNDLTKYNDVNKTIIEPLSHLMERIGKFTREVQSGSHASVQQMKDVYGPTVADLNMQATLYIGRQNELRENIEGSLPRFEILKKRIIERDNLLIEYDNSKYNLRSITERPTTPDKVIQAENKYIEVNRQFMDLNARLTVDMEENFNIFYNNFNEEFHELIDVQFRIIQSINEIHKQLGFVTMETSPNSSHGNNNNNNSLHMFNFMFDNTFKRKSQKVEQPEQGNHFYSKIPHKTESKGSVLNMKTLEEYIIEENLVAEEAVKSIERQRIFDKQRAKEDEEIAQYEGRVVPLCKICKKEVPIEFINEHSVVCSSIANDESVLVEEALWIETIEDLEQNQYLPKRKKCKSIKKLMRTIGVPDKLRSKIWPLLAGIALRKNNKDNESYNQLLKDCEGKQTIWVDEIERDLYRTFPKEEKFQNEEKIGMLRNVLNTYAYYNPNIGYCQSMNFVVAIMLLHLSEEDAFWMLVIIIDEYLPSNYYSKQMYGIQAEQQTFKHLLNYYFPKVAKHLRDQEVDIEPIIVRWFMCLFISVFPLEGADRLFELFLYEGDAMLFRLALALFRMHERNILQVKGVADSFEFLQNMTKITNFKKLIRLAYHINVKPSHINPLRERYLAVIIKEDKERQIRRAKYVEEQAKIRARKLSEMEIMVKEAEKLKAAEAEKLKTAEPVKIEPIKSTETITNDIVDSGIHSVSSIESVNSGLIEVVNTNESILLDPVVSVQ